MIFTKKERRFFIIWMLFHLTALIVNLVPIKGNVSTSNDTVYLLTSARTNKAFWPFIKYYNQISIPEYNTNTVWDYNPKPQSSPLDTMSLDAVGKMKVSDYLDAIQTGNDNDYTSHTVNTLKGYTEKKIFYGIFDQYDLSEFIVYVLLGVAIVVLPKIW